MSRDAAAGDDASLSLGPLQRRRGHRCACRSVKREAVQRGAAGGIGCAVALAMHVEFGAPRELSGRVLDEDLIAAYVSLSLLRVRIQWQASFAFVVGVVCCWDWLVDHQPVDAYLRDGVGEFVELDRLADVAVGAEVVSRDDVALFA
jgi:hypothetical protein